MVSPNSSIGNKAGTESHIEDLASSDENDIRCGNVNRVKFDLCICRMGRGDLGVGFCKVGLSNHTSVVDGGSM